MCDADRNFFDAHLILGPEDGPTPPAGMCGGVAVGSTPNASTWPPSVLRAAPLDCIVGPNDARYPADADVLDVSLDGPALVKHLKEARAHWWPLCGSLRRDGKPLILYIRADDFGSVAKGITRLARAYPTVRFIVDPFPKGKDANWQAGVCLADVANIWITTRGLYASENTWPNRSEREALYFTIGEVGAGKLLFASGLTPAQMAARSENPEDWLLTVPFVEAAQRDLILRKNAAAAFAPAADTRTLHAQ